MRPIVVKLALAISLSFELGNPASLRPHRPRIPDSVHDLLGGVVLVFWSRGHAWVTRERERSGNPKLWEWCQWLAEQITERRATLGHAPAHLKHRKSG